MRRHLIACLFAASGLGAAHAQPGGPARNAPATDIRDIRGPVVVASLPPFALTGGALFVAGGVFLLHRKLRRRQTGFVATAESRRSDVGAALSRLAADYRRGICSGSELIVRIDDLLRVTLAEKTGIAAQRLTSTELLRDVEAFLDDHRRALLKRLVALSDRVKFAAHQPDAGEVDAALSAAAGLFDQTLTGQA